MCHRHIYTYIYINANLCILLYYVCILYIYVQAAGRINPSVDRRSSESLKVFSMELVRVVTLRTVKNGAESHALRPGYSALPVSVVEPRKGKFVRIIQNKGAKIVCLKPPNQLSS